MSHRDNAVQRMTDLAKQLEATLTPEQEGRIRTSLDDPQLREWRYLPGDRPGVPLADLTAEQEAIALDLVAASESPDGADLALGAIEVERVRRTIVGGVEPPAGSDRYWLRLIGRPGQEPWGWRINGHHLAVHVFVAGGECTVTPHFIGSEPAVLPDDSRWPGRRMLGPEEDMARDLLDAFEPDRRAHAVAGDRAPDDILTGNDPVAEPSVLPAGLARGDMTTDQQAQLDALVHRYFRRAPQARASAAWSAAVDADLDRITFAWAGAVEPGVGRYYCLRGPTFLIEYDNTQDDANHAHSVWRDAAFDWGEDLLRQHRATDH
ncbi:DUF3500 domain-containing protein [Luteipulveratus mongoliensis]|uniref:DUF3500 domain-containing protein n=1 Tax=Luteipulveratus mongoliensis TaxID=571913 RepID=A0A0K1JIG6_9MICO|nr:DUF3500 domain-containing protein [Luteipulveratus mongoliensis]AKU16517.1 hypothetical protein VV02_12685 [Luteipulveratus mongoliensis]